MHGQEVDSTEAKVREAAAQLENARAALAGAQQEVRVQEAAGARTKTLAGYTIITAPFSGLITKRYADPGAMIQAGTGSDTTPIVQLSQIDRLRLAVPIPQSVVARIATGQVVKIHVPALDRTFEGRIARISKRVDFKTGTAREAEAAYKARAADEQLRDAQNRVARDIRIACLEANTAYQRMGLAAQLAGRASETVALARETISAGPELVHRTEPGAFKPDVCGNRKRKRKVRHLLRHSVLQYESGKLN